jgi:hypothetical protein
MLKFILKRSKLNAFPCSAEVLPPSVYSCRLQPANIIGLRLEPQPNTGASTLEPQSNTGFQPTLFSLSLRASEARPAMTEGSNDIALGTINHNYWVFILRNE